MKPVRPFSGFARPGGRILCAALLAVLPGGLLRAQEIVPAPPREALHTVGVELDYLMAPIGFDDPYAWPLGGGLFYEVRPLRNFPGLHVGGSLSAFSVAPLAAGFGSSFMVQPGLYAGYDLLVSSNPGFTWSPGLYAGYKHYFRRYLLGDQIFDAYRPIAVAGLRIKLWIGRRLSVASGAEYNLVFDNTLLHTVAFTQRLGLRLGGGSRP